MCFNNESSTIKTDLEDKKITIIGLGLIGGSLAKVLRKKLNIKDITAITRNQSAIDKAISDNIISRGFYQLNNYVYQSDIIFICTPVKKTLEYIQNLSSKLKDTAFITDVGSTKAEIVDFVDSLENCPNFIGGHPMTGAEKSGYPASITHLFENAYYILTPGKKSTKESEIIMLEIIKAIGGIPIVLDPNEHDMITASISHIPHIIASALVNMVRNSETPDSKMRLLAAGGFKDITRIASSNPEMWENIVSSNKKVIRGILSSYVEILDAFMSYIDKDDTNMILDFFDKAKIFRDSLPVSKKGLIPHTYELIVDVVDKPGILGEIASLLGTNSINIKNINISNSREFEQGCMRITLPDAISQEKAFELLQFNNYKTFKV
jgi:prephenate dehydrogenase